MPKPNQTKSRRPSRSPEPPRLVLYVRLPDELAQTKLRAVAYRRKLPVAAVVRSMLDAGLTGPLVDEALDYYFAAGCPPLRNGRRTEGALGNL